MPKPIIRFLGVDELINNLHLAEWELQQALEDAARAGGELIREAAERDAPGPNVVMEVESASGRAVIIAIGPDRDHWYYQFAETGAGAHEITAEHRQALRLADGEFYGRVQHSGMAARPFLRPAVDRQGQRALDEIGRRIMRMIEARVRV
jgi:HK97 gp10 family phage protein